jgi:hypothetical protein
MRLGQEAKDLVGQISHRWLVRWRRYVPIGGWNRWALYALLHALQKRWLRLLLLQMLL